MYFPTPLVGVMRRDEIERFGVKQVLTEPEMHRAAEPDSDLVTTLRPPSGAKPRGAEATACMNIQMVLRDMARKTDAPLRPAHRRTQTILANAPLSPQRDRPESQDPGQPEALSTRVQDDYKSIAHGLRPHSQRAEPRAAVHRNSRVSNCLYTGASGHHRRCLA